MEEPDYLIELKRRRAITQSFTWKIALPFWKFEMRVKKLMRTDLAADDSWRPKSRKEQLFKLAISPVVFPARILGLIPKQGTKFAGLPPRTEEVFQDLRRERTRRTNNKTTPAAKT